MGKVNTQHRTIPKSVRPSGSTEEKKRAEEEERKLEKEREEHQRDLKARELIGWSVYSLIALIAVIRPVDNCLAF